jgi:hypothetical protein
MDDTTGRVTASDAQDDTDARTLEIREEIAQTRVEMSETIEAIQERLTPSHLVAQAGETVRNATTEKVKQMANTAGHAADQVMDSSVAQTIRSNPIPVAMIGIGTAWLLMKRRSGSNGRDYSRYRTDRGYGSGSYGSAGYGNIGGDSDYGTGATGRGAYDTGTYGTDQRDWRVGTASETAVGTSGYDQYGAGRTGESTRVPEFAGDMRGYDRYRGRSTSGGFERVVRDNPLLVGAAAALVGVAIGMSVPSSETENRLMGEARDSMVDRAKGLASDAAEKVQDVAGQAANAATQVRDAASRATGSTGSGSTGSTGAAGSMGSTGSIGSTGEIGSTRGSESTDAGESAGRTEGTASRSGRSTTRRSTQS